MEGILGVADGAGVFSSPVRIGVRMRGGVGCLGGCLGSNPRGAMGLEDGVEGGWWVCVAVGVRTGLESFSFTFSLSFSFSFSLSLSFSLSRANRFV